MEKKEGREPVMIGKPNIKRLLEILARIVERKERERANQKPAA